LTSEDLLTTTAVQYAGNWRARTRRPIAIWLAVMAALVLAMVVVGGATRLTDSGLSITEWQPLLGAIPPLDEAAWQEAFAKYRTIPQASIVNAHMSLAEFKVIYAWEWAHRLLGRLIGVAFALPFLFFLARGGLDRRLVTRLGLILGLGALQGFIGWFMVQSGLADRIDVSPYRLTLHLLTATGIFALLVATALDVRRNGRRGLGAGDIASRLWAGLLVTATFVQIGLGGFVAGLKAGRAYNTWPLMDGRFVPDTVGGTSPWFLDPFENMATAQLDHRLGAYVLLALALAQLFSVWRRGEVWLTRSAGAVVALVAVQAGLGIWTLLAVVPISLALLHQAGAMIVLAAALWHRDRAVGGTL
jgi:heme a synthase